MVNDVAINSIKPAAYNPRKITEEQKQELCKSIRKFGLIVPILVNRKDNVIIAGHQRTKAARLVGIETVPVQYVESINLGDEIKFNQIHNATESGTVKVRFDGDAEHGKFIELDNNDFTAIKNTATVVKEICGLTLKYGNVLSAVICKGDVILGGDYVKACKVLGIKVNAYVCDDSMHDDLLHYFGEDYGEYSYEYIKRDTYVQGLAQLHRSVSRDDGKRAQHSTLYVRHVIPYLKEHSSAKTVLDFGCGKGAYIKHIKTLGYDAMGVEFFNNNGKAIDVTKGNRMIDALVKRLREQRQFDVVVCDSVLNSVDSMQAERSVIDFLNLVASDRLFISGRPLDAVTQKMKLNKDVSSTKRFVEFLDADNFSANYRSGKWYFQHFHSKEQIKRSLEESGFEIVKLDWEKCGSSWQCEAVKTRELPLQRYIDAIDFEFDLPLPNGRSYKRNGDVKKALAIE